MSLSAVCNEAKRTIYIISSFIFSYSYIQLLLNNISTKRRLFFRIYWRRSLPVQKHKNFFLHDTMTTDHTTNFFLKHHYVLLLPPEKIFHFFYSCACISMFLVYLNKVVCVFFLLIIHTFYHTQCHKILYIFKCMIKRSRYCISSL
jgi:hypothetical protein